MRLYEYEGKKLAAHMGIPIPEGQWACSPEGAEETAARIGNAVVVKAQILAGGRGKAGGIRFASDPAEAGEHAARLIGSTVCGKEVNGVLVEEALSAKEEYYLGIVVDEIAKKNLFVLSRAGGVEVENLAALDRSGFVTVPIDPSLGIPSYKARELARDLGLRGKALLSLAGIISRLYSLYLQFDAVMVEMNPLIFTVEEQFIAADFRMDIDDDALFRQKELEKLGIHHREERGREPTPLEMEAAEIDRIDHRGVAGRVVEFDGDIALVIGGGGASLTVFDSILQYGGKPANYCEIGGNPTVKKVEKLTELLMSKPGIKCLAVITNVLSNTRVDLVARGVIKGLLNRGIDPKTFPIVFRVVGSYEDEGYRILEKYGIKWFDRGHTMDEAAKYIVDLRKQL